MLKKKLYSLLKRTYPHFDEIFNKVWHDQPLIKTPLATVETYQQLFEEIKDKEYHAIQEFETSSGFSIDREWLSPLALHTQIVIKKSTLCYQHGPILYSSLRKYLTDNKLNYVNIIETGTARGFSSLCLAKALEDASVEGKIISFDVLPHTTPMFWNCIDDIEGPKSREALLHPYQELRDRYLLYVQGDTKVSMPKVQISRVHFAFLDGAHTFKDVLGEYEYLKNKQKTGDIIVFDDYTPTLFPGVVKAVDHICKEYSYNPTIIKIDESRGYVIAKKI